MWPKSQQLHSMQQTWPTITSLHSTWSQSKHKTTTRGTRHWPMIKKTALTQAGTNRATAAIGDTARIPLRSQTLHQTITLWSNVSRPLQNHEHETAVPIPSHSIPTVALLCPSTIISSMEKCLQFLRKLATLHREITQDKRYSHKCPRILAWRCHRICHHLHTTAVF